MTAPSSSEWHDSVLLDVALLDPRQLVPHPRNVRLELGDLDGLTTSIAGQGVIEPLTVIALDAGGYQLVDGHRRTAAAIAAGVDRVPCIIRRDLSVDAGADRVQAEHVSAMLATALQHAGLSAMEEARGVQMMLDLGADVDVVAARTGLDRKRVLKAAGVARLAPGAAAAVETAGLTLDQAAVVARFDVDDKTVGDLVAAAGEGPGRFAHAVTRAERARELVEAMAATRAELEAAGRAVLEEEGVDRQGAARIFDLLHDGQVLDAEQHASCPGSAVALLGLDYGDRVSVRTEEVCTAPAANGHTSRWGRDPRGGPGSSMSDEELERQRAERREVLENNAAMAAATTTRRAWIREYFARRTAPKEVLRYAVEAIATHPDALYSWLGTWASQDAEAAAGELGLFRPAQHSLGESLTSGEHVVDGRLPLQLLAHIAGAIEGATPRDAWRSTGPDRERLAGWLTFLAGQGYELSDIEQTIVTKAVP